MIESKITYMGSGGSSDTEESHDDDCDSDDYDRLRVEDCCIEDLDDLAINDKNMHPSSLKLKKSSSDGIDIVKHLLSLN